MVEKLTIREILRALGGTGEVGSIPPETPYQGVSTDSREDCSGRLFVALRGERFDGHRFISQAMEKGALFAITEEAVEYPHIMVKNTLNALHQIAALVRNRFKGTVVAITGTNGKTTTKEMLRAILEGKHRVHCNPGNLNNLIGMPLTLANTPADAETLVLEMGTNQPGELTVLSTLARHQVAVITTIGQGHLGPLGGCEGVRKAKMEVLKGVVEKGFLVTNADNPQCPEIPFHNKLTFGLKQGDLRAKVMEHTCDGSRFLVTYQREEAEAEIYLPGTHHVYNALAAIGAAMLASGIGLEEATAGLKNFKPVWGRCMWESVNGVKIINDAYNSNPDSLTAALKTLTSLPANRHIAVVGDMLELGEYSKEAHRQLGRVASEVGLDLLCTYGELAALMGEEAASKGVMVESFSSHGELAQHLKRWLQEGDMVLVKGSRGMEMERVIALLRGKDR